MRRALVPQVVTQDGFDLVTAVEPNGRFVIFQQRGTTEQFTQARHGAHGQRQIPVGRGVDAVRRAKIGMAIVHRTARRMFAAIVEVRGQHLELEVEDGFHEADLHPPPRRR